MCSCVRMRVERERDEGKREGGGGREKREGRMDQSRMACNQIAR